MKKLAKVYTENLHDHFVTLYATWPPGSPINLGDFGTLDGDIFIPKGNIKDKYGINFDLVIDDTNDDFEFKSSDSTEINFNSKGSLNPNGIVNAKASIEIKFSRNESIYFTASDCKNNRISNTKEVGETVVDLWGDDKWDADNVVITSLVESKATTIIVSAGKSSSIKLEANSDNIESINLSDSGIGLSVVSESNIGFKAITKAGMVPLIGLMGLKNLFWTNWPFSRNPDFRPYSYLKAEEVTKNDKIKKEDLYLGNLS